MNPEDLDLVHRAGRLLDFALRPRQFAGKETEYAELISLYQTSSEFRSVFGRMIQGLSMKVLEVSPRAMLLGVQPESALKVDLGDLWETDKPEMRLLRGLVVLGIAALCYPRQQDLDQGPMREFSPRDVDNFLRDSCERLAREREASDDPDEFERAWRIYRRQPAIKEGQRMSASTTIGLISQTLRYMVGWGLVRDLGVSGGREHRYKAMPRFQSQIRDVASQEAFAVLQGLRQKSAEC